MQRQPELERCGDVWGMGHMVSYIQKLINYNTRRIRITLATPKVPKIILPKAACYLFWGFAEYINQASGILVQLRSPWIFDRIPGHKQHIDSHCLT